MALIILGGGGGGCWRGGYIQTRFLSALEKAKKAVGLIQSARVDFLNGRSHENEN
jgi:hypothetical protein